MSIRLTQNAAPLCPACGKPLGLYYAECLVCYAHAVTARSGGQR